LLVDNLLLASQMYVNINSTAKTKTKRMKRTNFFSLGRKWFFTLTLFLFVFVAASVVKIQAAGNVTGWLWGGSEDCDMDKNGFRDIICGGNNTDTPIGTNGDGTINGNETGLGWISMNGDNVGGGSDYGVTIPSSTCSGNGCKLSGYAWSEWLGYVSFNELDLAGCPSGGNCYAYREGNFLKGWARFMAIKQAGANSGGWDGWISLSGLNYGVDITKMDGTGNNPTYAWSASWSGAAELGWIDFSRAEVQAGIEFVPSSKMMDENSTDSSTLIRETEAYNCGTVSLSSSNGVVTVSPISTDFSPSTLDSQNVSFDVGDVSGDLDVQITATSQFCGSAVLNLQILNALPLSPCSCGPADGKKYCGGNTLASDSADLCKDGDVGSSFQETASSYTWTCGGSSCSPSDSCSAGRFCFWIETNP
jgi:hypothetical protein